MAAWNWRVDAAGTPVGCADRADGLIDTERLDDLFMFCVVDLKRERGIKLAPSR